MKKLTIIGMAVCVFIVAILAWQHIERPKLTGTWIVNVGQGSPIRWVTTVSPDGSYVCQISGYTNGMIVNIAGTLEVKNGVLIDTMTKNSNTNAVLPHISRGHIVRFDNHELAVQWDGDKRLVVLRKESK